MENNIGDVLDYGTGCEVLFEFELSDLNCPTSANFDGYEVPLQSDEYDIGIDESLMDLDAFFSENVSAAQERQCTTTSGSSVVRNRSVPPDCVTDHVLNITAMEPVVDKNDFLTENGTVMHDSYNGDEDVSPNEIVRAVKIKKKSKKDEARLQRESGTSYLGYSRRDSKVAQDMERSARKQGPHCISSFCRKSSLRHCNQFRDDEKRTLFEDFWGMNWAQKQMYICQLVELNDTKQRRTNKPVSRRKNTNKFFLITENGKRIQVCRKMFLNTFGLKEKMVRSWVKDRKKKFGLQEHPSIIQNRKNVARGQSAFNQALLERKIRLLTFLIEYPKLESHYCRKGTEKEYFETEHQTLIDLYKQYNEVCKNENSIPLSFPVFSGTLKNLNFCLFKPRKDQCDICSAYKAGNLNIDEFKNHRKAVHRASKEKEMDVEAAKRKMIILLCMDAEGVVLCPKLKASALYHRSKLQIHNFTIYDIFTHDSSNYVWDETESDLQSSTFTSIVIHHLEKLIKTSTLPITIYSDGCGYQNRNVVITNALRLLAMKHSRNITQKFLEVGHMHMECDSTHACIERKTRDMTFNLPDDFETAVKTARDKPFPYEVEHLTHTFFHNYDDQEYLTLKSIRPGKKVGDPKVNDLRCLQYTANGDILYKLNFDDDFKHLPQPIMERSILDPKPLHNSRLPISFSKWKHLQELKDVLDAKSHCFYDNIPHCEEPKKKISDSEKLQNIMEKVALVKRTPNTKNVKAKNEKVALVKQTPKPKIIKGKTEKVAIVKQTPNTKNVKGKNGKKK